MRDMKDVNYDSLKKLWEKGSGYYQEWYLTKCELDFDYTLYCGITPIIGISYDPDTYVWFPDVINLDKDKILEIMKLKGFEENVFSEEILASLEYPNGEERVC